MKKGWLLKLGLVVLILIIVVLGYGGWCRKKSGDSYTTSGSSTPPTSWTKQLGTAVHDKARGVATDTNGNIYVAGHTEGDLHGQTHVGNWDIFVIKYNSNGVRQWTRQLGSTTEDVAYGVATNLSGNIYVVGSTWGDLGDVITNTGESDLFMVKYDSDGEKQWARQLGSTAEDAAMDVATDITGNIYAVGYTYGDLDGYTSAGEYDLFVVKYNSDGEKQWTRQLGTANYDSAHGVATDLSDNIYVVGGTKGDLGEVITNTGETDLFVIKYNSAGTKQWTRQLGTNLDDSAHGVATDTSNNIYVVGGTDGDLDGYTHSDLDRDDLFVVKYNTDGEKQWTRLLGTADEPDVARDVATDLSGNIYAVGYTYGDLDGNTNAGNNHDDLFVVKYNPEGEKQWTRQLGSTVEDKAWGVATDTSGHIYVTGYTHGDLDGNTNASDGGWSDLFVVKYNSAGVKQ